MLGLKKRCAQPAHSAGGRQPSRGKEVGREGLRGLKFKLDELGHLFLLEGRHCGRQIALACVWRLFRIANLCLRFSNRDHKSPACGRANLAPVAH